MSEHLRVSVRAIVEYALRAGDLDLESFSRVSPIEAIRAHQKLQASRGEGYRKEVAVSRRIEEDDLVLEIHGRIDGVWEREAGTLVEEIKTTRGDLEEIAVEPRASHWGQLRLYALFYAEAEGLQEIDGRLTYYHLDSGRAVELDRRFSVEELRRFFDDVVARYLRWARALERWRGVRDASIREVSFPHTSYRQGQREMAVEVYRAIRDGGRLLVQAPTGLGKTLAALFPSVKALAAARAARIFYLTARTTGRALAERALAELRASGLELRALSLTAKEKICFNPEKACNGEECEFARGFYDRIDDAVEEGLAESALTRGAVERVARRHRVCPFELSLELSRGADVIIGDYNYVFDPRVSLRRVFDEGDAEPFVLLVDEAHNLVDRARDMFSAEVRKAPLLALRRAARGERYRGLRRALGKADRALLEARRRVEAAGGALAEDAAPEALTSPLEDVAAECAALLADAGSVPDARGLVLERYFELARFLKVAEGWSDVYATCYETQARDLRVRLFCTDPAPFLAETLDRAEASIFFSATLTPPSYFVRLFGAGEDTRRLRFDSPFPAENLEVLVASRVATTYRRRRESEAELTRLLIEFVGRREGRYLLYFPSYEYMRAVHARFVAEARLGEDDVLLQTPDMTERARADFLARFEDSAETLVGFAVLGGVFGEGIDLPGERLTGVAVVGVGLPGISPERDRIRVHFDRAGVSGFDYAYVYPGMNRVLQAAGRVIRSEVDRGTVLLVDERFGERRYRALLPPEWRPSSVTGPCGLRDALSAFWESRAARVVKTASHPAGA